MIGGRWRVTGDGAGPTRAAVDTLTGAPVFVRVERNLNPGSQVRLLRWAIALRILDAPGVARILDAGRDGADVYVVTERVEGAPFPGPGAGWGAIGPAAVAALHALARVHALGISHGRVGAGSIRVDRDGRVGLVGFGRAESGSTRQDVVAFGRLLVDVCPEAPPRVAAALRTLSGADPVRTPRDAGAALRVLRDAVGSGDTRVFDAEALRDLFVGPDRVLHLREDAARALHARTGGLADRVAEEIDLWLRYGLARRTEAGLAVDRATVDRLRAEPAAAAWAWRAATGDLAETARDALREAARLEDLGQLSAVRDVALHGILAARGADEPTLTDRLARLLVWATGLTLEPALYRDTRERLRQLAIPEGEPLDTLLAGLEARDRGDVAAARDAWTRLAPFPEPDLDGLRQSLRAMTALHHGASPALGRAELDELDTWASSSGSPLALALVDLWRGLWLYRNERYAEAATRHLAAAARRTDASGRLSATLNAASAMIEVDPTSARVLAEGVEAEAARLRLPFQEARAVALARSARYRSGQALAADPEVEQVVPALLSSGPRGAFLIVEAAAAWRQGRNRDATRLARAALQTFESASFADAAALAAAFVAVLDPPAAEPVPALVARARACRKPWAALQAFGLLSLAAPGAVDPTEVDAVLARLDPADLSRRRDVLALDEALALCRRSCPVPSVG